MASDEVRQEFLMWYLKSAFDTLPESGKDTVQDRLSEVQSAIFSPVDMMKRFLGTSTFSPPRAGAEPEVEALRKRVAELEARLETSARGKPKRAAGKEALSLHP